ncbi:MAG: acyltransferase [Gemmatimonadota bacterium]
MTPAPPQARTHLLSLDGIRGLAVLIVIIHNATYILGPVTSLPLKIVSALAATGWAGVQMFFVLSGFLITGILVETRTKPQYFRSFYIRRTLRIFPLYYGFLILVFVVAPPLVAIPDWTAQVHANEGWYWSYLSNWSTAFGHGIPGLSHFWSLAVEEQFYVVWPLLVWALSVAGVLRVAVALMLLAPLCRYLLHLLGLPQVALYEFTISRMDALAAGAALAILVRDPRWLGWITRRWRVLAAGSLLALVGFTVVNHGFQGDDLKVQVLGQTLLILACLSLLVAGLDLGRTEPSGISRVLQQPVLRMLGKYSYAMYVFHFPIHTIASFYLTDAVNQGGTADRLARLAGYDLLIVVLSLGCAMLSWFLFEARILALKDRWAPRPVSPLIPTPAALP